MTEQASTDSGPASGSQIHPELAEERRHLEATVALIREAADAPLRAQMGIGDETAALAMEAHRAWRRAQLYEAVGSPYFARIDFLGEGASQPETYYIGKTFFERQRQGITVTGWQAPVASLFYRSTSASVAYTAPDGEIRGRLRLKRRFVIHHSQLTHLGDDLDERPQDARRIGSSASASVGADASAILEGHATDDLLRAVLTETASPWLRDIIATIQTRQYALIAAPADQVLVIQGVAGSGKTSIALHRLSYLIYPAMAAGKLPPRCLIFGPNRLFLKYVSAVLPRLGLHHAAQTTVTDWALERMRLTKLRTADATFEALLNPDLPPAEKDVQYRRSRLKTSRRMGTLLEHYVEWRRSAINIPEAGWMVRQKVGQTSETLIARRVERVISAGELRERYQRHAGRPFAAHRAAFAEGVLEWVIQQDEAHGRLSREQAEAQLSLGFRRLKQAGELRAEVQRLGGTVPGGSRPAPAGAPPSAAFGAAPSFGSAPLPRGGGQGARGTSGVAEAQMRQTLRQLELSAERRRQEGDVLVSEARAVMASALSGEAQELARKGARERVRRLVDAHWPAIDALPDYYALLGDPALLRQLAAGVFSEDDLALLGPPPKRPGNTVDLSDLPAIHYLFVLSQHAEVVGRISHDYVVIDEAQDVAELDLHCLHALERKQRFTLLGDLAQSIYGHRGLTSWDQAAAIFHDAPYTFEECAINYRSTAEIVALANRVRRAITSTSSPAPVTGLTPASYPAGGADAAAGSAPGACAAPAVAVDSVPGARAAPTVGSAADSASSAGIPTGLAAGVRVSQDLGMCEAEAIDRHGPPPRLVATVDQAGLLTAVTEAIAGARHQGYASVAVITRTAGRARELADQLNQAGVSEAALVGQPDFDYRGGVIVLPLVLAKGLEFDCAIVVDADARTYPATSFDARLLYVALTRALHALHILWTGEPSPHLTDQAVQPAPAL